MRRQVLVCCLRGITPDEPQVHARNLPARGPGRKKNKREGQEGGLPPNRGESRPNRFSPESLVYAARIAKFWHQPQSAILDGCREVVKAFCSPDGF